MSVSFDRLSGGHYWRCPGLQEQSSEDPAWPAAATGGMVDHLLAQQEMDLADALDLGELAEHKAWQAAEKSLTRPTTVPIPPARADWPC